MPYITTTERTAIKKGMQLGELKGMQLGELKGQQLGEAKLLKKLLARRFGSLPNNIEQRIDSANSDELELWADRVLDVQSLLEIFQ